MKKQKIQLIVLLIILGVAIVAWFGIKAFTKKKEASSEAPSYTAFTVDPKNITNISCHNQAGSFSLDYDSSSSKWTFTDFPDEVVDNSQAQLLADALKKVTSDNEVTNVTNSGDYGFDNPSITIDLTMKDGTKTTLYVGDENTALGEYYFRVGDSDTIYTVSVSFYNDFNVDHPSLVSADGAETSSSSASSSSSVSQPTEASSSAEK